MGERHGPWRGDGSGGEGLASGGAGAPGDGTLGGAYRVERTRAGLEERRRPGGGMAPAGASRRKRPAYSGSAGVWLLRGEAAHVGGGGAAGHPLWEVGRRDEGKAEQLGVRSAGDEAPAVTACAPPCSCCSAPV